MSLPKVLINAALAKRASIGRDYDSQAKHIAYWYRVPGSDWKVYRGTVAGMLHVLRHVVR
jgi:hypothetical protein